MKPYFLLSLIALALCTDCKEDDDGPNYCLEPEMVAGCQALSELSVEEHFAAIVGQWYMTYRAGFASTGEPFFNCLSAESGLYSLRFNADSTYLSLDYDVIIEGRWEIVVDTLVSGETFTRLQTDNGIFFGALSHTCEADLAYLDNRSTGGNGNYYLFKGLD